MMERRLRDKILRAAQAETEDQIACRRLNGKAIETLRELFDDLSNDERDRLRAARWLVALYATTPGSDEGFVVQVSGEPGPCKSGFPGDVGAHDDALVLVLGGEDESPCAQRRRR